MQQISLETLMEVEEKYLEGKLDVSDLLDKNDDDISILMEP